MKVEVKIEMSVSFIRRPFSKQKLGGSESPSVDGPLLINLSSECQLLCSHLTACLPVCLPAPAGCR
jgi:hypothetical protein